VVKSVVLHLSWQLFSCGVAMVAGALYSLSNSTRFLPFSFTLFLRAQALSSVCDALAFRSRAYSFHIAFSTAVTRGTATVGMGWLVGFAVFVGAIPPLLPSTLQCQNSRQ
jgi:hypothetical protein